MGLKILQRLNLNHKEHKRLTNQQDKRNITSQYTTNKT